MQQIETINHVRYCIEPVEYPLWQAWTHLPLDWEKNAISFETLIQEIRADSNWSSNQQNQNLVTSRYPDEWPADLDKDALDWLVRKSEFLPPTKPQLYQPEMPWSLDVWIVDSKRDSELIQILLEIADFKIVDLSDSRPISLKWKEIESAGRWICSVESPHWHLLLKSLAQQYNRAWIAFNGDPGSPLRYLIYQLSPSEPQYTRESKLRMHVQKFRRILSSNTRKSTSPDHIPRHIPSEVGFHQWREYYNHANEKVSFDLSLRNRISIIDKSNDLWFRSRLGNQIANRLLLGPPSSSAVSQHWRESLLQKFFRFLFSHRISRHWLQLWNLVQLSQSERRLLTATILEIPNEELSIPFNGVDALSLSYQAMKMILPEKSRLLNKVFEEIATSKLPTNSPEKLTANVILNWFNGQIDRAWESAFQARQNDQGATVAILTELEDLSGNSHRTAIKILNNREPKPATLTDFVEVFQLQLDSRSYRKAEFTVQKIYERDSQALDLNAEIGSKVFKFGNVGYAFELYSKDESLSRLSPERSIEWAQIELRLEQKESAAARYKTAIERIDNHQLQERTLEALVEIEARLEIALPTKYTSKCLMLQAAWTYYWTGLINSRGHLDKAVNYLESCERLLFDSAKDTQSNPSAFALDLFLSTLMVDDRSKILASFEQTSLRVEDYNCLSLCVLNLICWGQNKAARLALSILPAPTGKGAWGWWMWVAYSLLGDERSVRRVEKTLENNPEGMPPSFWNWRAIIWENLDQKSLAQFSSKKGLLHNYAAHAIRELHFNKEITVRPCLFAQEKEHTSS